MFLEVCFLKYISWYIPRNIFLEAYFWTCISRNIVPESCFQKYISGNAFPKKTNSRRIFPEVYFWTYIFGKDQGPMTVFLDLVQLRMRRAVDAILSPIRALIEIHMASRLPPTPYVCVYVYKFRMSCWSFYGAISILLPFSSSFFLSFSRSLSLSLSLSFLFLFRMFLFSLSLSRSLSLSLAQDSANLAP